MAQKELDTGCSEDPDLLSTRQSVEQNVLSIRNSKTCSQPGEA